MKVIKGLVFFFLLIVCFSSNVQAFGEKTFFGDGFQKHYIQGVDVRVANNGIFVNFEGTILNVSSVFMDESGAYIVGLGTCSRCGFPNDDMGKCQNARCPNYRRG